MNIPLRIAKTPNNFSYSIEHGDQEKKSTYLSEEASGSSEAKSRDFFGHCYNCGCLRHSQNYCPLKLCSICAKYGHDQRVCFFNPSRKIWSSAEVCTRSSAEVCTRSSAEVCTRSSSSSTSDYYQSSRFPPLEQNKNDETCEKMRDDQIINKTEICN